MTRIESDGSGNSQRATPAAGPNPPAGLKHPVSRRAFLKGAGGVAGAGMVGDLVAAQPGATPGPVRLAGKIQVELSINGQARKVEVEPRTTLLDALRVHLDPALTGTKLVCGMGSCGACTVFLDGQPIYSCLRLAVDCVGKQITTIEGLAGAGALTPVQEAFVDCDALMCGFCTPGLVMSVTACLNKNPSASLDEIRRATSGNTCRCGTYPFVFDAALAAGRRIQDERNALTPGGTNEGASGREKASSGAPGVKGGSPQ